MDAYYYSEEKANMVKFAVMDDAHITALASIGQVALLFASAILIFWYLIETRRMRQAAERQVEATFRPALIVTHGGDLHSPQLGNIGSGPAMDVSWSLKGSDRRGTFSHIQTGQSLYIPQLDTTDLYYAAAKTDPDKRLPAVITCQYKSLSGRQYTSVSSGNLNTLQFTTSFKD